MKLGLLLPGQGAQTVGMGIDFAQSSAAAQSIFAQADEILGLSLSSLCFNGPLEELTRTDIAQPAIYTCSLAALAALEEKMGKPLEPSMAAGLSLGEYTALTAANALSFADGLRLVRLRGQAMQEASEQLDSSMTSVLGLEREPLEAICDSIQKEMGLICQVANLNSPGQIVVSGQTAALDLFDVRAKDAGARRAIRLSVAGAFHSEVMRPAAAKLDLALESVEMHEPRCPVWQNASAKASSDPSILRENLSAQLCAPVLWADSFAQMSAEMGDEGTFLEPAPGRVLAGLARKIDRNSKVLSLHQADAIPELLAIFQS
ncbi:MAG: ACP S-malonyltransferase [Planctomycetes bacterium]|nr:ACP S-malonyltransferase [Planctomycetota bacterium]